MAAKIHRLNLATRNKAYRWSEQDGAMAELCHLIDDSELSIAEICERVAQATKGQYKISASTISNWMSGKTRRPQNYTLTWVGYALGYTRRWEKE